MLAFLALLPRVLVTFFYALAALLRFFVDGTVDPYPAALKANAPTLLGWSLSAFVLASAALLVDLGVEWNRGTRRRHCRDEERNRQLRRLGREDQYRKALAQFLLEPSDTSRRGLRELIAFETASLA
jgi:hypothetical protein